MENYCRNKFNVRNNANENKKSQISNTYEGPVNVGNKKQQGLEEPVNCQRVQLTYDIYEESDASLLYCKLIATTNLLQRIEIYCSSHILRTEGV